MATAADPTLASLDLFDDLSKWDVVHNVPAFKPHIRKDEKGKELFRVTEKDLKEIARLCNKRATEDGVHCKLQIGHTRRNIPETEQAPLVGYAKSFKVGKFGPKRKPALICDFYYRKNENTAKIKEKFPFRSAEYYPDTKEISTIALLQRDPALDLGMLVYEGDSNRIVYFYSSKELPVATDMVDDDLETQVNPDAGDADINPEEIERFKKYMKHAYPQFEKMHQDYNCSGPGMPSSTNVKPPAPVKGAMPKKPAKKNYERDGDTATEEPPSALVRENAELYQRVAQLEQERKADRLAVKYEKALRNIDPSGENINLDEELADLRTMSEEQATKHLARLERTANYSRQPIGQDLIQVDDTVSTARDEKPPTAYERDQACDLVTETQEAGKEMTFGEALKAVRARKFRK